MNLLAFVYGATCYLVFFLTFLYTVGFLGGFGVPRSVDAGGPASPTSIALLINTALLTLFAVQHSGMARQGFKAAWTRFVPPSIERSTYVLLSSLVFILLFWQWRPMPSLVWDVQAPLARGLLWGLFGGGCLLILLSTSLINHFELFGLQQVWRPLRGERAPPAAFREPSLYKIVRHPLYVGWILVFWAVPTMTVGHLLFSILATGYILAAIPFEERDLGRMHPEYAEYRRRVPMLIPGRRRKEA